MQGRKSGETTTEMEEIRNEDRDRRKEEIKKKLSPEMVEVQPFYYELRNEIIKPKRVVVETKYFLEKWVPLLGPVLSLLVIKLRSMCYWNSETGEKRNYCFPSQDTLAKSIGVSRRTIIRELQHPLASKFIRVEPRYRYDAEKCRKVRTSNIYHIAMDDPLTPEDEKEKLVQMAAERILKEEDARKKVEDQKREMEKAQKDRVNKVTAYKKEMKGETQVIENKEVASKCQIVTQEAVPDCHIKEVLEEGLKIVNVINDFKISKNNKEKGFQEASAELLAQDIAKELEDKKSLGFYRKVARACSHERLYSILSEVKLLYHEGRIRKSRGAAFTDMVKRSVSLA